MAATIPDLVEPTSITVCFSEIKSKTCGKIFTVASTGIATMMRSAFLTPFSRFSAMSIIPKSNASCKCSPD